MKKKICFGGFKDTEVHELQPALAEVSGTWEFVFAPDGPAVRACLVAEPIAALVVDVRMENRSGPKLLHEAAASHPHTLRFALGDVDDRELVVNSIGAPYQFVSRPWKANELTAVIERALAIDAWLNSDKLRAFVPKLGRLPSLPSTYFEVLKRAESPNVSVESVAEVIARDPALTARLLQTVNSAASGVAEKITSPVDAVSVLGLDIVKSLVLCLQVFDPAQAAVHGSISLDSIWRQSFKAAQTARRIAAQQSADTRVASDAYAAGLLHRIGQIVLVTNLGDEYGKVVATAREQEESIDQAELATFGVTSNQVGAYLLGLWGMPLSVVEAVALYLDPASSASHEFSLLTAVHVAHVLACEEGTKKDGILLPELDRGYLDELDLPTKPDAWRKRIANDLIQPAPADSEEPSETSTAAKQPTPAKTQAPRSRPARALVAAGAFVLVAVAAVLSGLGSKVLKAASPKAEVQATTDTPDDVAAPDGQAPSTRSPFALVKVEGIFYRTDRPAALINGRTLSPGDRFNGFSVVSIQPTRVVLEAGGEQKTFDFKKPAH